MTDDDYSHFFTLMIGQTILLIGLFFSSVVNEQLNVVFLFTSNN